MKTKLFIVCIIIPLLLIGLCGSATGARTIPASNETAQITFTTTAAAIGTVMAQTGIVYVQGNGNLNDNPPLEANGEGQSTISYREDTMAINGAVSYTSYTDLDTADKTGTGDNLYTERIIEYSADGDDQTGGRMLSDESILVDVVATGTADGTSICPFGAGQDQVLPATCDIVVAGSEMDVTEASVTSQSSARTTSSSCDTPVELSYSADIRGINQTPGDMNGEAVGSATIYVDAHLQEGLGNETAKGTDVTYSDVTSASGLFDLAKDITYTSA
jgi:hypothetical protein